MLARIRTIGEHVALWLMCTPTVKQKQNERERKRERERERRRVDVAITRWRTLAKQHSRASLRETQSGQRANARVVCLCLLTCLCSPLFGMSRRNIIRGYFQVATQADLEQSKPISIATIDTLVDDNAPNAFAFVIAIHRKENKPTRKKMCI